MPSSQIKHILPSVLVEKFPYVLYHSSFDSDLPSFLITNWMSNLNLCSNKKYVKKYLRSLWRLDTKMVKTSILERFCSLRSFAFFICN